MTNETSMRLVIDCDTNTSTLVPLTEQEIADMQKLQSEWLKQQEQKEIEEQARLAAKASAEAKLAALGLTPEEIAALR